MFRPPDLPERLLLNLFGRCLSAPCGMELPVGLRGRPARVCSGLFHQPETMFSNFKPSHDRGDHDRQRLNG